MEIMSASEGISDAITSVALDVLRKGGVIAYPTESYYALGVLATDESAVKRLFAIKKRKADKPLPVIVGDMDVLASIVKDVPDQANDFVERFWPGALTLIFRAGSDIPSILTGGTGNIAARIPGNSEALSLIRKLKLPVTATSANPSSQPPADNPEMVHRYFGNKVDLLIDGGTAPGGKPSTIVDITVKPARIVREGRVKTDAVC